MNKKTIGILVAIPLLIGLIFFENIKGYFRFQWYCSNEGGLKVYEKLEKNVGWMAEDYYTALEVFLLEDVKFVRFSDKKNKELKHDLYYKGGKRRSRDSYETREVDSSQKVKYVWTWVIQRIETELRLEKFSTEILDYETGNLLVGNYHFIYSIFNPNNTLLAAPSGTSCTNTATLRSQLSTIFQD